MAEAVQGRQLRPSTRCDVMTKPLLEVVREPAGMRDGIRRPNRREWTLVGGNSDVVSNRVNRESRRGRIQIRFTSCPGAVSEAFWCREID